ncbi:MAG: hypothetical protein JWN44_7026 [Myxococcales bacterium]|nr:hypothetical protein [Myxococcales bacterium]
MLVSKSRASASQRDSVCRVHAFEPVQISVEDIDLRDLAGAIRRRYGSTLYTSYLRGKTVMRDAIESELRCSAYQAEELVETLEMMGYVRFPHLEDDTHPLTRHAWVIEEDKL